MTRRGTLLTTAFIVISFLGFLYFGNFRPASATSVYTDFCEGNSGTSWEVPHKYWQDNNDWGPYFTGTYSGINGTNTGVCGSQSDWTLVQHEVPLGIYPQTGDYAMLWWTQCVDPVIGPNVTGETFINFKAFVTTSGGNNLGPVAATDSSGNSCPVVSQPDLSVSNITLNKTSFAPSETVTISYSVTNNGGDISTSQGTNTVISHYRNADLSTIQNCPGGPNQCATVSASLGGALASGVTVSRSASFSAPSSSGSFSAWVYGDSSLVLSESNETNNYGSVSYSVVSASAPSCTVSPAT